MRDEHKVIRSLLQDYMEWYERNEKKIGYPDKTVEQRAIETGVKRHTKLPWEKNPWMSNKETIIIRKQDLDINYPRKSFSVLGRILPDLPVWMQKIIKYNYHPVEGLTPTAACKRLKIKLRTYERRTETTLREVNRRYKLANSWRIC